MVWQVIGALAAMTGLSVLASLIQAWLGGEMAKRMTEQLLRLQIMVMVVALPLYLIQTMLQMIAYPYMRWY